MDVVDERLVIVTLLSRQDEKERTINRRKGMKEEGRNKERKEGRKEERKKE